MDRQRLTITLKKDILAKIDNQIDGASIRNRSHAIEYLLSLSLPTTVDSALILAGGDGIKMRPLTYVLPKAMIPVRDHPILYYIIDQLRNHGIKNIIIALGLLGYKIQEYFGDGSRFGVKISYLTDNKQTGTANPIRQALPLLGQKPFLVYYGDVLADINLRDFIEFHETTNTTMTMAVTTIEQAGDWGVVTLRGNSIKSFNNKPHTKSDAKLINAGIYILNPSIVEYLSKKSYLTIEKDVIPKIIKNSDISGYTFDGQWFDIATPKIYELALKHWMI